MENDIHVKKMDQMVMKYTVMFLYVKRWNFALLHRLSKLNAVTKADKFMD